MRWKGGVDIRVGFIGGFGRSGSTLLERVIAELPGVCALGEVVHLWERGIVGNERCGCGQPFRACPFWTEVGDRAFGGWDRVDTAALRALAVRRDRLRHIPAMLAARPGSPSRAELQTYSEHFLRVYRAAAEVSGAELVVDSSKHASTAYALSTRDDVDLRVVHIVRDSRGVAYSWTKRVARPEAVPDSPQPLMHRYPPHISALLWTAHNLAFEGLHRLRTPVHRVLYERFLADPVGTTEAVATFLGLDPAGVGAVMDGESVALAAHHQVAGNPLRFRTGVLPLTPDDTWRAALPARSRRLVTAVTWPLMAGYGYLPKGRR